MKCYLFLLLFVFSFSFWCGLGWARGGKKLLWYRCKVGKAKFSLQRIFVTPAVNCLQSRMSQPACLVACKNVHIMPVLCCVLSNWWLVSLETNFRNVLYKETSPVILLPPFVTWYNHDIAFIKEFLPLRFPFLNALFTKNNNYNMKEWIYFLS